VIEHIDEKDLQEAKDWAYNLLHNDSRFFILDTETTGLGDAEIVNICVMTQWGQPLLNTLVKPTIPIPSGATHIHKITDEMVADAPTFPDIYPKLKQLIEGKKVIIYNEAFDCNIIRYCCKLHNLEPIKFYSECAMLWYAQYYGAWNDYYGNYRWQKLPGGGEHRALADCEAVHRLLHRMGKREYTPPETPHRQFPPIQIACEWEKVGWLELHWRIKTGFRRSVKIDIRLPAFGLMKDNKLLKKANDGDKDDPDVPF
jgi:DNA polymerase III epsilon subunit-like protein